MYQTQRSCRQDTVLIEGALLPMDVTLPFEFWELYKDNKSCFCFTVHAMSKNKEKLYQLKLIVSFKPKKAKSYL